MNTTINRRRFSGLLAGAVAAPDRLAPSRSATPPETPQRQRPNAGISFDEEVSLCPPGAVVRVQVSTPLHVPREARRVNTLLAQCGLRRRQSPRICCSRSRLLLALTDEFWMSACAPLLRDNRTHCARIEFCRA
jgi:hypothetical protein